MLTYSPSTSFLRLKSYTDPANLHPVQGYNSDRFVVWKIQLEIARDPDFFLGESKEKEEEEEEEEEESGLSLGERERERGGMIRGGRREGGRERKRRLSHGRRTILSN